MKNQFKLNIVAGFFLTAFLMVHSAFAKNVTFLTLEGGAGHVMIENAFKEALVASEIGQTVHMNSVFFNKFLTPSGVKFNEQYVYWAEKNHDLWDKFQDITAKVVPKSLRTKGLKSSFYVDKLAEEIRKTKPDMIYCTHYTLAEIITLLKVEGLIDADIKVVSQVTDFSIIPDHNTKGLVVVPHEKLKEQLVQFGKDPSMIQVVGGIPARANFISEYNPQDAKQRIKQKIISENSPEGFDLDLSKPIFVAAGGGDGRNLRFLIDFLPSFNPSKPINLVVICGKNQKAYDQLAELRASGKLNPNINLVYRGFEKEMHLFMKASDVFISKPGGSTTAEIMALGRALFVNTYTGIQEKRNLDFLAEFGAVQKFEYVDLNDVDAVLKKAAKVAAAARSSFPNAKNVPGELVSVFDRYLNDRIAESSSEVAELKSEISEFQRPKLMQRLKTKLRLGKTSKASMRTSQAASSNSCLGFYN